MTNNDTTIAVSAVRTDLENRAHLINLHARIGDNNIINIALPAEEATTLADEINEAIAAPTNTDPAAVTEDGVEVQLYAVHSERPDPGERPGIIVITDDPGAPTHTHLHFSALDAFKLAHGILNLLLHDAKKVDDERLDAMLKRYLAEDNQ